jgi:hypothetical protein
MSWAGHFLIQGPGCRHEPAAAARLSQRPTPQEDQKSGVWGGVGLSDPANKMRHPNQSDLNSNSNLMIASDSFIFSNKTAFFQ